jgi:hypothetical protein
MNEYLSSVDTTPLITRIAYRIFPSKHCDCPEPDGLVSGKGDVICLEAMTELSFTDRLRVLVSGRISSSVKIATEYNVGATKSLGVTFVRPPRWTEHEA